MKYNYATAPFLASVFMGAPFHVVRETGERFFSCYAHTPLCLEVETRKAIYPFTVKFIEMSNHNHFEACPMCAQMIFAELRHFFYEKNGVLDTPL